MSFTASSQTENVVLYIDSKFRTSGDVENFTIQLDIPLKRVTKVEIVSAEIPYTFYNVTNLNNTIVWTDGTTPYTATIEIGNYTVSDFVTTLKTAMDAEMPGFTITYIEKIYKLQFANATAFQLLLDESTMASSIGLLETTALTVDTTLSGVINISGPRYLLIKSDTLTRPKITRPFLNTVQDNVLYKVDIQGAPGDILVEKNLYTNLLKYGVRQTLQSINFTLVDPDDNQINLNGQDWSLTLNVQTS